MTRILVLVALAAMTLAGCKKKPTPAQLAAATYAELATRLDPRAADSTTEGRQPRHDVSGGEPTAGDYQACGESAGVLDWVRAAPVAETPAADGAVRVEVALDLCMRAEDSNGGCTRPNTYTALALMRLEEGAWKVAGSTCVLKFGVR